MQTVATVVLKEMHARQPTVAETVWNPAFTVWNSAEPSTAFVQPAINRGRDGEWRTAQLRSWAWHDHDEQDEEEDDQLDDCYLMREPKRKHGHLQLLYVFF